MKTILTLLIPFISGAVFIFLSIFLYNEALPFIISLVAIFLTMTNITYSASRNSKNSEESDYYTNAANTFFKTAISFLPLLFIFYILRLVLKVEINLNTVIEYLKNGRIITDSGYLFSFYLITVFIITFIAHTYFKVLFNFVTELYRLNKYLKDKVNDYHFDFIFFYLGKKINKKKKE